MSIRLGLTTVATATQVTANTVHITSTGSAHSLVKDSTVVSAHAAVNLVSGSLNQVDAALSGDAGKKFKPTKIVVTATATDCPAFLVCGAATAFGVAWTGVADGEFRINMNGLGVVSVTTCNFGACANMDDVAAVIQARLRVATGSTETVTWVTDHFVITSANTDPTVSSVTVLTAALAGTDISGAGATNFLNGDAGNGIPHLPPAGAAASITVGTSHAGTEILPATVLTGLRGLRQTFEIAMTGLFPDVAGNATMHVTATVGDGTALNYFVEVDVMGTQS